MLLNSTKPLLDIKDIQHHTLLHDMTRKPWKSWFKTAGVVNSRVNQGPIFSHSSMVLQAAIHGQGIALVNSVLAQPEIDAGRLVVPFNHHLESKNAFYLVLRESQVELGKIVAFKEWMLSMVQKEQNEAGYND
jgi:LysR family glycine cleavage system transcriptional activator